MKSNLFQNGGDPGWSGSSCTKTRHRGPPWRLASGASCLTEDDIPGSSLNGRDANRLKNSELKFWLKCRGDSCEELFTKAQLCKRYFIKVLSPQNNKAIPIKCFVSHRLTDPWFWKSKKKIRITCKEASTLVYKHAILSY